MKRKWLAVGIILLFVETCIIPAIAQNAEKPSQPTSRGNWLYVGGSGPGNYTRIQDAIDNTSDGDTVFVFNGTYYENIVIDNSINLIGENKDTTVIDGGRTEDVVDVTTDGVVISDFGITNSSNGWSIEIHGSSNIVFNCIIFSNLGCGVRLTGNSNNLVNCNINSNQMHGIYIDGFNGSHVSNCSIFSNNYYGIFLDGTENCHLSNSNIFDNNVGIKIFPSSYNTIVNCDIHNNEQGIQIYGEASESNNNTIKCNKIIYNIYGIHVSVNSNNNLIFHNNLINNTLNARDECSNFWDNGYPSCGNYWDDHSSVDNFSGSNQNIPGSDGVGDDPYDLPCEYATDCYPLMEPYGMTILSFDFKGGLFKWSGIIKNIGNNTAFNVQWKIIIDGGFVLLGRESSGIIPKPLLAGEETQVRSNFILGFGKIMITIAVWADNAPYLSKSTPGTLLLFFIKI